MDYFVALTGLGDCLCHADKHAYTHMGEGARAHAHTCTSARGERTWGIVYAEAELIFMSCGLLFMGKIHF